MNIKGIKTKEDIERSRNIYNDWQELCKQDMKSYEKLLVLMDKYKISDTRIWTIISREKKRVEKESK